MEKVTSLNHLKTLSNINGFAEFEIILAGGLCCSSKQICYYSDSKTFDIFNEVDETWQRKISDKGLAKKTMIIEAIETNSLIYTGCQRHCINECDSNCPCK